MVSAGKTDRGMRMNYGCFIKEPKNKSLRSAPRHLSPLEASEIVLFIMICTSNKEASEDDGSSA